LKKYEHQYKPASKLGSSSRRHAGPSAVPEAILQHTLDDDSVEAEKGQRPTSEILAKWKARDNDKNKENIGEKAPAKPSLFDRQPDARKVEWDENYLDGDLGTSNRGNSSSNKRPYDHDDEEESEHGEDEGFQEDERAPDPHKRMAAPPAARRRPIPATLPSPKRARVQSEAERQPDDALQASTSYAARVDEHEEFEDDESVASPPMPTQVRITARINTQRVKPATTQKRTPWSASDEDLLINLMADYGCSWSMIQQVGRFEREVNQVALKDKARNLKVNYLK